MGATRAVDPIIGSTDHLAYGDLFQWGRGADGHQLITRTNATTGAAVNGTTTTLSSTDTPGNALFIKNGTAPNDWRSGQNVNLWQGVNGTNNPCPSGYRLPTQGELDAERLSWTTQDPAGAFASLLKLPVAGYRNYSDGLPGSTGSGGFYWSSTISSGSSLRLRFNSIVADMLVNVRAGGASVRCIMD